MKEKSYASKVCLCKLVSALTPLPSSSSLPGTGVGRHVSQTENYALLLGR